MFKNPRATSVKALGKISKLIANAHIEPMYGSIAQNAKYISKEAIGGLFQFGDKPAQGTRADLLDVVSRIRQGEITADQICVSDPDFYHQYGRTLSKAEDILLRHRHRTWMTRGTWYHGGTGVGKSHRAFDSYTAETHYVKCLEDDWWDGYAGQGTVILNDFRGQLTFSNLLTLVDKWPTTVKRRNREPVPFLAEHVIVTCDVHPSAIYHNVDPVRLQQLERRFKIVEIRAPSDLEKLMFAPGQNGTQVPVLP